MNLRFSPQGLLEAKRIKTWWRANRPAALAVFERELEAVLERIQATPHIGISYHQGDFEVLVRRVLLPKSRMHVYYAVGGDDLGVLSVWAVQRGSGPRL